MKQKIFLLCFLIVLCAGMVRAAGSVASIELADYGISDCETNTMHGSYRLIARDSSGAVANGATPVNIVGVFIGGNGSSFTTPAYGHNSTDTYTFDIYLGGASYATATAYFYVASNPAIRTPDYLIDCVNNTMTLANVITLGADDRLNPGKGDLMNVLYARTDSKGSPEIRVYSLNSLSQGVYTGAFPFRDFQFYLAHPPQQNRLIRKIGKSTLYALATGEFQINVGPDAEGKVYSVIFSGLPPENIYYTVSEK